MSELKINEGKPIVYFLIVPKIFIEDLNDVPINRPIIFSAHGVSKKIINEASQKKSITIDATCPLVTKVHIQALKFYNRGYQLVLIGHKNHPEVEGTMGQVPEGAIILVEDINDVDRLKINNNNYILFRYHFNNFLKRV